MKVLKKPCGRILVQPRSTKSKEWTKEHEYAGKQVKDLITNEKHLLPCSLDYVVIFIHFFFFFFFKYFLCYDSQQLELVCVYVRLCVCAGQKNITNLKRKRMGTVSGTWPWKG